jgi:hypothetical protein
MQTQLRIRIPQEKLKKCYYCLNSFSLSHSDECPDEICIDQKRIDLEFIEQTKQQYQQCMTKKQVQFK